MGIRIYELIVYRENKNKRETKHIEMLKFLSGQVK